MDSGYRRARPLLGTLVSIEIDLGRDAARVDSAFDAAFAAVERVHRSMSFHEPASDLSRLNRAAVGAVVTVDPWLVDVLAVALELHRRTGGVFDPGIAPVLVRAGRLPGQLAENVVQASSIGALEVLAEDRVLKRGEAWVDLGGIAKGFAVDAAVRALTVRGIEGGIVNAGGDLRVFGDGARTVVLRHPLTSGQVSAPFELRDMACCSSVSEGFSPNCVDPRFGSFSTNTVAATVVAPQAIWADGLTKVAILEGELKEELALRYNAQVVYLQAFKCEAREVDVSVGACA